MRHRLALLLWIGLVTGCGNASSDTDTSDAAAAHEDAARSDATTDATTDGGVPGDATTDGGGALGDAGLASRHDECGVSMCGDHGTCMPDGGGETLCLCDMGYSGPACAECAIGYEERGGSCQAASDPCTGASHCYFVDVDHPSASDANPGSESSPWATLQQAASTLEAGDVVLVKNGTYTEHFSGRPATGWTGLKPQSSGTPDSPIVYRAYPGHRPVLDQEGGAAGFFIMSRDYITIDGFEIRNCRSGCIRTADSAVGIVVQNCHVHDIDGSSGSNVGAIFFHSASYSIARNNVAHSARVGGDWNPNAAAIHSYNMRYMLIEHNELYDAPNGMFHKSSSGEKGVIFRRNVVHGVDRGVWYSVAGTGDDPHVDQEVYENLFYDVTTGVRSTVNETDQVSHGLFVHNNTIVASEAAVSLRGAQGVEMWNNILDVASPNGGDGQIVSVGGGGHPTEIAYSDYNLFAGELQIVIDLYGSSQQTAGSLEAWRSISHPHVTTAPAGHSSTGAPQYRDPDGGDYQLQPGSPGRGMGRDGEDLGAYRDGAGLVGPTWAP